MPANGDRLRTSNTEGALSNALFALLENHDLKDIAVTDICEKAQVNRAVFYAHFSNKYDLLTVTTIRLLA